MVIGYTLVEHRDLSYSSNRQFVDPGYYTRKTFICKTDDQDRKFTLSGTFHQGFEVTIYNKGPNNVEIDAVLFVSGIGDLIGPNSSASFIYSSYNKAWHAIMHAGYKSIKEVPVSSSISLSAVPRLLLFLTSDGTIDNITGGAKGSELIILANNQNVTLTKNASGDGALLLNSTGDLDIANLDVVGFYHNGTDWVEMYRTIKI